MSEGGSAFRMVAAWWYVCNSASDWSIDFTTVGGTRIEFNLKPPINLSKPGTRIDQGVKLDLGFIAGLV